LGIGIGGGGSVIGGGGSVIGGGNDGFAGGTRGVPVAKAVAEPELSCPGQAVGDIL
jgi:hypothetical protein